MTETTTTTNKRRVPRWVWTVVSTGVVFGMLQVPRVWRAVNAGIEGGEHALRGLNVDHIWCGAFL